MKEQIKAHNLHHFLSNPLAQNLILDILSQPAVETIDVGDEDHSVIAQIPAIVPWHLEVHRCPQCSGRIVCKDNYEYAVQNGHCLVCDHVMGEVMAYQMDELTGDNND